MTTGADIAWLTAQGLQLVGFWAPDNRKMQRNERLERNPGIYAFVVHGTLRYLGKATYLRSRLRAYNRSLKDDSKREHRRVHVGIRDIWRSGGRIDVWVLYLPGVSSEKLYQREHRWIKETSPDWNAT